MKPETKAKLDKIVPLLAHWMEGGNFLVGGREKPCLAAYIPVSDLILVPERYSIFKEPRVIYVNDRNGELGMNNYPSKERAEYCLSASRLPGDCEGFKQVRFIEDLNWNPNKPDLDADHHLPEPSEKAKAYQSTV